MKILVRGYYGFGNLGDDVLMMVTYRVVKQKYPDADFFIFSNFTPNLQGFKRADTYNHYIHDLLGEKVEIVDWTYQGTFDLLVDGGGGVFFDMRRGTIRNEIFNQVSISLGVHRLTITEKFIRKLTGKARRIEYSRKVGFGLGIGEYSASAPLLSRHMADIGRYTALLVRDKTSLAWLAKFKFSGQIHLFTDIAFLHRHWLPNNFASPSKAVFNADIAMILMDWKDKSDDFFDQFLRFEEKANASGYQVTYYSFDENYDSALIEKLATHGNLEVWQPGRITLSQFVKNLSRHSVVITSRAHGAILGAQLDLIPICINHSQKLVEVSRMFPSSGFLINLPIDFETVLKTLDEIRENYPNYLERLKVDVLANRRAAQHSEEKLLQLI